MAAAATTSIADRATTLAATLSDRDVDEVVKAYYGVAMPPPIKMVEQEKPADHVPAGAPYVYYAGTDARGNALLWQDTAAIKAAVTDNARGQEAADELVSAYIAASVMQGRIGAHWRAVFASNPGPRVYARAFVIAWEHQVAVIAATSRTNIAWADATFHPGMPRAEVYDLLRNRGLIAWDASAGLAGFRLRAGGNEPGKAVAGGRPKAPAGLCASDRDSRIYRQRKLCMRNGDRPKLSVRRRRPAGIRHRRQRTHDVPVGRTAQMMRKARPRVLRRRLPFFVTTTVSPTYVEKLAFGFLAQRVLRSRTVVEYPEKRKARPRRLDLIVLTQTSNC